MSAPVRNQSSLLSLLVLFLALAGCFDALECRASAANPNVGDLVAVINQSAGSLQSSAGMRRGFESFSAEYRLTPESVRYSDYVIARLVYEAARDAGFWGMHWSVTNKPPNSDQIWRQWTAQKDPSFTKPTATAECDELSALYAFLVERAGVRGVGLFWPYPNHTVAVWVIHTAPNSPRRVVVPTSQIFLGENDDFGTKSFDPWTQKQIYEYTRHDVPDTFELPKPLFDFFVAQLARYGGASDAVLQKIRYMRDAVFRDAWTPEEAAQAALRTRVRMVAVSKEDSDALENFARDMRAGSTP